MQRSHSSAQTMEWNMGRWCGSARSVRYLISKWHWYWTWYQYWIGLVPSLAQTCLHLSYVKVICSYLLYSISEHANKRHSTHDFKQRFYILYLDTRSLTAVSVGSLYFTSQVCLESTTCQNLCRNIWTQCLRKRSLEKPSDWATNQPASVWPAVQQGKRSNLEIIQTVCRQTFSAITNF